MTVEPVRRGLAVRADDVVVELGGRRVLDAVSLALEPGSFSALTGPSGAGKSTLLWVLGGALRPTSGSVSVGDEPVGDEVAAAARGVLLVPQGATLAAPLTARENVVVPQLVHRVPAGEAGPRADAALHAVRLEEQSDHLVEELSGGQQQRVTLARTLALRPAVLLADEPTSELDAGTRDVVVALLAAEAAAGATVLLATHDAACAEAAGAELHLDEGRLVRVR
ncbi:ABC transporter ATP-binding protein [Lapillicoccus jejuensis]|uniref:Putative ABC transport system ATP-binding protein n=1 Tax=Lapillicoccus jejuensis TaxID=402171 RepID=A0A542E1A1_9MICO|nr:ATP-binding cassette domain-containing protein [Lapillicoccus jejuensis]TQJ09095.1 putative ABC transport system ATP-binding protein [Lapillicoccus jejuensis]